jgi:hypothetical protein
MTQAVSFGSPSGLHLPGSGRKRIKEVRHEEPLAEAAAKLTSRGSGDKVEVRLSARKPPEPNYDMLNALARVEQIQRGMNPAVDDHSLEYLREARSGGMYDAGPDE